VNYCRQCVLPDTRPGLTLDAEGVCNACRTHATRRSIDWAARGRAFAEVARSARERAAGYDCLIPVSGGKDSTWQVLQCLEQGLRVLAVTWKTPARTDIGRANLDNLIRLGVDHIDYQIHPEVERRFMRRAFERCGTTGLPMHMALFAIPLTLAVRFKIPLVVWGENSAFEYGGPAEERTGFALDAAWLKRYGVTHGTTAADWVGPDLTAKDLVPYRGPTDAEMAAAGVRAVFLGYYFSWDPIETYRAAAAHGFRSRLEGPCRPALEKKAIRALRRRARRRAPTATSASSRRAPTAACARPAASARSTCRANTRPAARRCSPAPPTTPTRSAASAAWASCS